MSAEQNEEATSSEQAGDKKVSRDEHQVLVEGVTSLHSAQKVVKKTNEQQLVVDEGVSAARDTSHSEQQQTLTDGVTSSQDTKQEVVTKTSEHSPTLLGKVAAVQDTAQQVGEEATGFCGWWRSCSCCSAGPPPVEGECITSP